MKHVILVFAFLLSTCHCAFSQNSNWQYMGKVRGVYSQTTKWNHGDLDLVEESRIVWIYSQFDGDKMIYKAYVPDTEQSYEVNYCGGNEKVRYRTGTKHDRVQYLPSLSNRFSHSAGPYYFNMSEIRN